MSPFADTIPLEQNSFPTVYLLVPVPFPPRSFMELILQLRTCQKDVRNMEKNMV